MVGSAETNSESSYKPRKKKTENAGWVRQEKKWQNRKLLKIANSNGGP